MGSNTLSKNETGIKIRTADDSRTPTIRKAIPCSMIPIKELNTATAVLPVTGDDETWVIAKPAPPAQEGTASKQLTASAAVKASEGYAMCLPYHASDSVPHNSISGSPILSISIHIRIACLTHYSSGSTA